MNEKYSYKDFSGQSFIEIDPFEFNNSEIIGSCFAIRDWDKTKNNVFPVGMTGVTFKKCNLTNVIIPPGNILTDKSVNERILWQNDGEDWIVDVNGNPLSPWKAYRFDKYNLSKDPNDIPAEKVKVGVVETAEIVALGSS